jgi:hypothetical protein
MFMESAQDVLKGTEGGERVVCVVPLGGQPFEHELLPANESFRLGNVPFDDVELGALAGLTHPENLFFELQGGAWQPYSGLPVVKHRSGNDELIKVTNPDGPLRLKRRS